MRENGLNVGTAVGRQRTSVRPGPPRHRHSVLPLPPPTHELILGRASEARTLAVAAVEVAVRTEESVVEAHAAREVAIDVRGRPVEAVAAHIVDRSPIAAACGRKEDRTSLLKGVPLCRRDSITAVASNTAIGVAQVVGVAAPVVGQQDYTVHIVHLGLGIAMA